MAAGGTLASLLIKLGLDASGVKSGVADADKALAGLTKGTASATKVAAGVVGSGLALAAKGALEMEDRAAKFRAETGASEDEARHFADTLNQMAGSSLVPIDVLADSLTKIRTDLGATGAEADALAARFENYQRATAQGSDAVLAFDDILDAWNLDASATQGIMDVLIKSHQMYGGSIQDNQRLLAQLAPTLQAANMSWEEGQGLLNLFARAGVSGEAAATALNRALGQVESPQELQAILADISATEDPFARATKAIDAFGARAGTKLAQALNDADGDIGKYIVGVEEAAQATEDAANVLDDTITSKVRLAFNKAMSIVRGFGMDIGPVLTGAMAAVNLAQAFGLDRVLGPVFAKVSPMFAKAGAAGGAIFAKAMSGAMALVDWGTGLAKVGWDKLGALYGGKFGVAFRLAVVAAVALVWTEVWNQFNNLINQIEAKREQLASETAAAIAGGTDEVLAALNNAAARLAGAQGWNRIVQDTLQSEELMTQLSGLARDLANRSDLTASQIASGLSVIGDAIVEAQGRNDTAVVASLERSKAVLEEAWANLAPDDRVSKATAAQIESTGRLLSGALDQVGEGFSMASISDSIIGTITGPIDREFGNAREAIDRGFGSIKQALADPPQFIADEDRAKNMLARIDKLQANARKAKRVGDTGSQRYWERGVDAQTKRYERFTGRQVRDTDTANTRVRSSHARTGSHVKRTWDGVQSSTTASARSTAIQTVSAIGSIRSGIDSINLTSSGIGLMQELAMGIRIGIPLVRAAALAAAAAAAAPVKTDSPPKVGPLHYIDRWGPELVDIWAGGIERGVPRARKAGDAIAGAVRPGLPSPVSAGSSRHGGNTYNVGVLVADDHGIDALDRRMENRRRTRNRGHAPYND